MWTPGIATGPFKNLYGYKADRNFYYIGYARFAGFCPPPYKGGPDDPSHDWSASTNSQVDVAPYKPGNSGDVILADNDWNNDHQSLSAHADDPGQQGHLSQPYPMKYIDNNSNTKGVHAINKKVIDKLKDKHPSEKEADKEILLEITSNPPEHVIFEDISVELVQRVAKNIHGSGGPTKVDADFFRHILCSKFFYTFFL